MFSTSLRTAKDRKKILIVDDDPAMCTLLSGFLGNNGFECRIAHSGADALRILRSWRADVMILDVTLPGESGFEICRHIRSVSSVFILMLSSRAARIDRIVGMELGADDYMTKPFDRRELLVRINAFVRRLPASDASPHEPPEHATIHVGGWELDMRHRSIKTPLGRAFTLSAAECHLLKVFLERPNRIIDREYLARVLFLEHGDAQQRAIDMRVSRLRQRLGDDGRQPRLIRTIRNQGYFLVTTS